MYSETFICLYADLINCRPILVNWSMQGKYLVMNAFGDCAELI
jgi:hypothetical protein